MKPNNLNTSTDYGTIKNDTKGNTLSLTFTNGQTIAAGATRTYTNTLAVGTINAGLKVRANASINSQFFVGSTLYSNLSVNVAGIPSITTHTIYCSIFRSSETAVTVQCDVQNPYPGTITITANQTVTFIFSTFLSPFD